MNIFKKIKNVGLFETGKLDRRSPIDRAKENPITMILFVCFGLPLIFFTIFFTLLFVVAFVGEILKLIFSIPLVQKITLFLVICGVVFGVTLLLRYIYNLYISQREFSSDRIKRYEFEIKKITDNYTNVVYRDNYTLLRKQKVLIKGIPLDDAHSVVSDLESKSTEDIEKAIFL